MSESKMTFSDQSIGAADERLIIRAMPPDRIIEDFLVSDFTEHEPDRPSWLLPGRAVRGDAYFRCPKCATKHPMPRHMEEERCGCGLHWIARGNLLTIIGPAAGATS